MHAYGVNDPMERTAEAVALDILTRLQDAVAAIGSGYTRIAKSQIETAMFHAWQERNHTTKWETVKAFLDSSEIENI